MKNHEDDDIYENLDDHLPRRTKRTKHTKFREPDTKDDMIAKREKHSSKRSHRQKTIKGDLWPDDDE